MRYARCSDHVNVNHTYEKLDCFFSHHRFDGHVSSHTSVCSKKGYV
jgi:hypothetical protein